MKVPKEVEEKFFAGEASEKTKFGINASVSVLNGPHKGASGSIVSILSIEPIAKYLIELNNGSEIHCTEPDLAPL